MLEKVANKAFMIPWLICIVRWPHKEFVEQICSHEHKHGCIIRLLKFENYNYCYTGIWDLQRSPFTNQGLLIHFYSFGLFTWIISCGENLVLRGLQEGHKSRTVKFFQNFLRKNSNCGHYKSDEHIFFLRNPYMRHLITAP